MEKQFSVRLDQPRFEKLSRHILAQRLTNRAYLEKHIDELPKLTLQKQAGKGKK